MLDNELMISIRSELLSLLANYSAHDLSDVEVSRSYQPTQQAATEQRVIVIHRITNPQVGGGLKYVGQTRIEQRLKRATFQFDCLAPFDESDVNALLPSDIANIAADLLQSYNSIRNLRAKGVNIERVTDVRPSYFINDKERHESAPSFDLTVNYQHDYGNEIPDITGVTTNNYGV